MPFKKSAVNGDAPMVREAKGQGARPIVTRPNSPASTRNRVIVEGPGAGKSAKSTFTAPRKDGGSDPACCGYTKPGKM